MLKNTKKSIISRMHTPIRMCVLCKNRFKQNTLYRFRVEDNELCIYAKCGRSVYLCEACILKENHKWQKVLSRACKNMIKTSQQDLKERIFNDKS
ncbi:DUF448 domain-containing protein [Campylobacter helveticus]|uniref:DUF448 domain-containing protein n=2 Tax=Campylobacter helveticus TaxID=28898 RepID=A0AAX2UJS5_9BACT|nr:DUF448 domain-containing protein [Campylobacter helveticus]ARE79928.1 putative nucleic-acid-binding protein (DUF448 domain) [Campylobacter helveticus]TNB58164.1 DUF448 domain-containing protein [Campylobacter helveticus]TNB58303.1 DUF448 domain-containing protein [Campylobacter helveticus]TNB60504.1 DUF448 domain-containing protein [Campylobacter helveticus]TNH33330.1 DUF448 domain-containing protein [Campylobacter helveticus]